MAQAKQRCMIGKSADGKPIYKFITGKTQDERDIAVVRAFIESGRIFDYLPVSVMDGQFMITKQKVGHPFSEYCWHWYETYKRKSISTKYKGTIEGRIKCLCRFFEDKPIEEIQGSDVQEFLDSISSLTEGTVRYYRNLLSQVFDSAVEDGIADKNLTKSKRITISGKENGTNSALSLSECQRVISLLPTLPDPNETLLVALMLFAGLRREEVFGLRWEDIDFKSGKLNIVRAVIINNNNHPEVKLPKTKSSKRTIDMSDMLIDVLLPLRKGSGYILADEKGELFNGYGYRLIWKAVRRDLGLPGLKAPALRHTYATMNVAAGVDIKTVGQNMGHTKYATTADIYTQPEPEHIKNVRNRMSEYVQKNGLSRT